MTLFGPDVSHHQARVDWAKVAANGEAFGACKATEGVRSVDQEFVRNWPGIKAAEIPVRIAYHYGHTESSATSQAEHFVATVGAVGAGDVLCLDAEDICAASTKVPPRKTADWVSVFLARVMELSGLPREQVLLYTGQWWWDSRTGRSKVAARHPLWVADYSGRPPRLPAGWSDWTMHQYTDKARVPGVRGGVDRSRVDVTVDAFHELAGIVPALFDGTLPDLATLTLGARNGQVRALQERLRVYGLPVIVTGVYDEATRLAVAEFQQSRPELDGNPDGLVGPITLRLLFT
jgi:GH25 family lysozyme M1 (1,4-beta-N-acetylmuramidase)